MHTFNVVNVRDFADEDLIRFRDQIQAELDSRKARTPMNDEGLKEVVAGQAWDEPQGAQAMSEQTPIADAIADTLVSTNESDRNGECANIVDAVFALSRSIQCGLKWLGTGDAGTTMGALEAHAVLLKETGDRMASGLESIADSISDLADAIRESKR